MIFWKILINPTKTSFSMLLHSLVIWCLFSRVTLMILHKNILIEKLKMKYPKWIDCLTQGKYCFYINYDSQNEANIKILKAYLEEEKSLFYKKRPKIDVSNSGKFPCNKYFLRLLKKLLIDDLARLFTI